MTKVTVDKKTLLENLRVIGMATGSNLDRPEYSAIRISGTEGSKKLVVAASDGVLGVRSIIKCDSRLGVDVNSIVSFNLFNASVRSCSGDISLGFTRSAVSVQSGAFMVDCPTRNNLPVGAVVVADRRDICSLEYGELSQYLSSVSWLVNSDALNPVFASVHLVSRGNNIEAVASDIVSLAVYPTSLLDYMFTVKAMSDSKHNIDISIPHKFTSLLERLPIDSGQTVDLYTNDSSSMLAFAVPGKLELTTSLNVGGFPDYGAWFKLMDKTTPIQVDRDEVLLALGQINTITRVEKRKGNSIRLTFKNGLAALKETGVHYDLVSQFSYHGDVSTTVSVNGELFERGLRTIAGKAVTLHVPVDETTPLYVTGDKVGQYFILARSREK